MKILFSEISSSGNKYTLSNLEISGDSNDFEVHGPVTLVCTLQRKGKKQVLLSGKIQASVVVSCNRCLTRFPLQVSSKMQQVYTLAGGERLQLKEVDLTASDLDVVEVSEPIIDLEDIARQQLYMALPTRQLCKENCLGICPECGTNLNEHSCRCHQSQKNNPFSVLAGLKKV